MRGLEPPVMFSVLGPVEVWTGSGRVEVGPPRQRSVLAALAVDAGRVVPAEVLIDRVWGDRPPPNARRGLHSYIARLRGLLATNADQDTVRLTRHGGGYLLETDPERVDLLRMTMLVERARSEPEPARAALLGQALALWQGEPLGGVAGDWAARTRQAWQREYLGVVVAWAQAALAAGHPDPVIGRLTGLVGEHPLVEPLTTWLVRALASVGRTAEALQQYTTTARRLAEELGADPGAELRQAHQDVLQATVDPAPADPAPAGAVTPAMLPREVSGFAGRLDQLARLDALLDHPADQPPAVVISAVSGTAGVGKTALAVHWAHRVAGHFPGGQLYVNLRGFDSTGNVLEPGTALRGFLEILGAPSERIPTELDAQAGLYRSMLAGKRVLVVLDNARDADQVRPLLPGSPTALVVVTSRSQLTPLIATDGAETLLLDLLSLAEARELLARRLGAARVAADADAVERVIAACARLPLALSIAAALGRNSDLRTLAADLTGTGGRGRLVALDAGDANTRVRAVFSWSYAALTPSAARLFRLLGLQAGAGIGTDAVASLARVPRAAASRLLAELTGASLVIERAAGRYELHDLLATYAAELAEQDETDHARRAAVGRLLDHYTHTAYATQGLLGGARDPIAIPLAEPRPGTAPPDLADGRAARAWLMAEYPALLAAIRLAAGAGFDAHAWQLAWALSGFMLRRGRWEEAVWAWQTALAAAERLANSRAAAYAHRQLARVRTRLGQYGAAHSHLDAALSLQATTGDLTAQAHTHHALALLWERQNRPDRSVEYDQRALALFRTAGNRRGVATSLNSLGWYLALAGDHTQALANGEQALVLYQDLGDHEGEASTWHTLGYVRDQLGDRAGATASYQRALEMFRDLRDRYHEALVLDSLGDLYGAAGDVDAARAHWLQGADIYTDLGHTTADAVRAKLTNAGVPGRPGG